jgi:hypothetical protein
MKLNLLILICVIAIAAQSNGQPVSDRTKALTVTEDTAKIAQPDFVGADVVILSDWGEPDTTLNANVFVNLKDEYPHITMKQGKGRQCEVRIMKGITIKILDHKTGKLLKTYTNEE